jgi:hypothetical protein
LSLAPPAKNEFIPTPVLIVVKVTALVETRTAAKPAGKTVKPLALPNDVIELELPSADPVVHVTPLSDDKALPPEGATTR